MIGIVLFPGVAHATDLTINSIADMDDNCSYNSTTRIHECIRDSTNKKWTNVYVNIPKFVPTDVRVAGYTSSKYGWQQARVDSRHIIIEAKNDVVFATHIDMLGSQGRSGGWPGRLTVKAKNIFVGGTIKSHGAYFDKYEAAGSSASAGADVVLDAKNITVVGSILNYGGSCCCEINSCPARGGGNTYIYGGDFTLNGGISAYGGRGDGRYQPGYHSGSVTIDVAGDVIINGNLNLYGSRASTRDDRNGGSGGSVTVAAKKFNFAGNSNQYGGNGGRYVGSRTGNIYCGYGGASGTFSVVAEEINITGRINTYAAGNSGPPCHGGVVGDISLNGKNSVYLNYANANSNKRRVGAKIDIVSNGPVTLGTISLKGGPGTGIYGWCGHVRRPSMSAKSVGQPGGILKVYGDTITVTGTITATGGISGGENAWDGCYSSGGGKGGTIYLNALKELKVLNSISSDGGHSVGRGGNGGPGGNIQLACDNINITASIQANGAVGGPNGYGGSGGRGGKGGNVFVYTENLSISSKIEATGGDGGYARTTTGHCTRGSGYDGGKIVLFRNGSITGYEAIFDVSRGVAPPKAGCSGSDGAKNGNPGEKEGTTREADSGFRVMSSVKNIADMSNFTGSLQARIVDKQAKQYVCPPLSYATWQPYAQVYSGNLNSYLGREIPARIVLGRQYTMELILSDDPLFDLSNCNLHIAKCNPIFINFVEYYESV